MQKQKATFALVLSVTLMSGCSLFADNNPRVLSFPGAYKIDIQQGNVITQEMVNQLRPGMTRDQVRFVMGQPMLPDTYNQNRWDYIYSFHPGGEKRTQQTLTLFFQNDKLASFEGDIRPGENIETVNTKVKQSAQDDAMRAREALNSEPPEG